MLKSAPGKDMLIKGSGALARSLMQRQLIDVYVLLIHPLMLGSGRRLFDDDGAFVKLRLVSSVPTTTGVLIATYAPRDPC